MGRHTHSSEQTMLAKTTACRLSTNSSSNEYPNMNQEQPESTLSCHNQKRSSITMEPSQRVCSVLDSVDDLLHDHSDQDIIYSEPTVNYLKTYSTEKVKYLEQHLRKDVDLLELANGAFDGDDGVYKKGRLTIGNNTQMILAKSTSNKIAPDALIDEALIHLRLDAKHPNIITLLWIVQYSGQFYIVMQPASLGLNDYLKTKEDLTTTDMLTIGSGIASAMDSIASMEFVLQNLHTKSCMVTEQQVVKIVDFSMACDVMNNKSVKYKGNMQTDYTWLPPEVISKYEYTKEAEVWRFAVFLWSVYSRGSCPVNETGIMNFLYNTTKGTTLQRPANMSDDIYNLLRKCWSVDPTQRPRFKEVHDSLLLENFDSYVECEHDIARQDSLYHKIDDSGTLENPPVPPRIKFTSANGITFNETQKAVQSQKRERTIVRNGLSYSVQNLKAGCAVVTCRPHSSTGCAAVTCRTQSSAVSST